MHRDQYVLTPLLGFVFEKNKIFFSQQRTRQQFNMTDQGCPKEVRKIDKYFCLYWREHKAYSAVDNMIMTHVHKELQNY